ncbi:MAG: hypothetical protein IKW46_05730 [Bacteroidaceae bacterium]|nr:hypothetical protein [Bacteroidaceae bacterium]
MVDKFQRIYISTVEGAFEEMLHSALSQIDAVGLIKLAIFSQPADNFEYRENLATIDKVAEDIFGNQPPLTSYIAQKTSHGGVTVEATFITDTNVTIEHHRNYRLITIDGCTELMTGGIVPRFEGGSTFEQSTDIFEGIAKMLSSNGFKPSDIYRQWNYIPGITVLNDGSQNYQEFNDARSIFYGSDIWTGGYPAATGIGTSAGGVVVEICAIKGELCANLPIDNPLQIAAHNYSQQVLDGKVIEQLSERTTPKFERARLLGNTVLISGTAAIKGECSNYSNDAVEQAAETMEIMDKLTSKENIPVENNGSQYDLLRVYVKREQDIPAVKEYIQSHYPAAQKHYLVADVCRPELLIEIEGVARI